VLGVNFLKRLIRRQPHPGKMQQRVKKKKKRSFEPIVKKTKGYKARRVIWFFLCDTRVIHPEERKVGKGERWMGGAIYANEENIYEWADTGAAE
jgi:hypothetical protein